MVLWQQTQLQIESHVIQFIISIKESISHTTTIIVRISYKVKIYKGKLKFIKLKYLLPPGPDSTAKFL